MSLLRARAVPARPRILVLLDPMGALVSVARRPLWGLSVVVMLACAALPAAVYAARVDAPALVRKELRASGRAEQIPPERFDDVVARSAGALAWAAPAGAAAQRSVWMTFLSFVLLAVARGARPGVALGPVAGAVGVGMAPLALRDLIAVVALLQQDARELLVLDATNVVLSNPAAWAGLDARHTAAGLALAGLDLFELWSAGLVAFGVNVAAGTRSALPWLVTFGAHGAVVALQAVRVAVSSS